MYLMVFHAAAFPPDRQSPFNIAAANVHFNGWQGAREEVYNFRMDIERGSLNLKPEVSGAQYLLLHRYKGASSTLFKVRTLGPRVLSKKAMLDLGYPSKNPKDFYLVFDVEPAEGFKGYEWDYHKLPERLKNRKSADPQTVTLDLLMSVARRNLLTL